MNEMFVQIVFVGVLGVAGLIYVIGRIRVAKVLDQLKDPYKKEVQKIVKQLQNLSKLPWPEYQKEKPAIFLELEKYESFLRFKNPKKVKTLTVENYLIWSFTNASKLQGEVSRAAERVWIDTHVQTIKETTPDNSVELAIKHEYYWEKNKDYRVIADWAQEWSKTKKLYNEVMEEISEALSAISSAQGMETLDLFTKSKAISVISTMSTSSANSEIQDIKPALQKLENQLKVVQKQQKIIQEDIQVSDTFDLVVDLMFDFSFDFTSIFSLIALSDAESGVSKLKNQLNSLGKQIYHFYEESEAARLKLLHSYK